MACFDPGNIGRIWQPVNKNLRKFEAEKGEKFTLLCYNVLADCLLRNHLELYPNSPSWCLDWNYRRVNLMKEILYYSADIICLQEVESCHYKDWFLPSLSRQGYVGLYKQRTGDKNDGCALFAKSSTFHIIKFKGIEYSKENVPLLNRDNVGIVALLQMVQSKQKKSVCIATTHLLFNPKRGDIKLLQIACLMAEIDQVIKSHQKELPQMTQKHYPIIVCGDLNSLPHSPLYEFVDTGALRFNNLFCSEISGQHRSRRSSSCLDDKLIPDNLNLSYNCLWKKEESFVDNKDGTGHSKMQQSRSDNEHRGFLKHGLPFKSVYRHFFRDGTPEVTTCHDKASCTVDYVFYSSPKHNKDKSSNFASKTDLMLTGLLLPLRETSIRSLGGLPSPQMSSDHIPLLASFQFYK